MIIFVHFQSYFEVKEDGEGGGIKMALNRLPPSFLSSPVTCNILARMSTAFWNDNFHPLLHPAFSFPRLPQIYTDRPRLVFLPPSPFFWLFFISSHLRFPYRIFNNRSIYLKRRLNENFQGFRFAIYGPISIFSFFFILIFFSDMEIHIQAIKGFISFAYLPLLFRFPLRSISPLPPHALFHRSGSIRSTVKMLISLFQGSLSLQFLNKGIINT